MGWLPVGLSVMATLFSANSFVMYPSVAAGNSLKIGLMLIAFTLMAPVVLWVFIPIYARLQCQTAYEYLERRFHVSVRVLASGLFILLRIGWMASATYAASIILASVMNVSQIQVIIVLGIVSIFYTMLGGLRAVMWTDVAQFFIFSLTILLALGLLIFDSELGISGIVDTYFANPKNNLVDFTPSMELQYGSWALLIGGFLEGLSAFGADQVAVQRYISARSEKTSQIGFAINLLGMWIVIPGLLAIGVGLYSFYTHHPQELLPIVQQHSDQESHQFEKNSDGLMDEVRKNRKLQDQLMPQYAKTHFPPGVIGLFLIALMAAIMSSIDSGIHSVTTAIMVDFRDRLFPKWIPKSNFKEMLQDRLLVLTIGVISVGLACFVGQLGSVFDVGKKMTAGFGGPLLALFILAFFYRKATVSGVLAGTLGGALITIWLMYHFKDWFSVWFWPIGFGLTLLIALPICLLTKKETYASKEEVTYWDVMRK